MYEYKKTERKYLNYYSILNSRLVAPGFVRAGTVSIFDYIK